MADDAIRNRFLKVLEVVFKGDAGKMALELGLDRSTMTRYKNGSSTPSQKILVGLSHAKRIRLAWLKGDAGGEEIEYDEGFEYSLPFVRSPLAGGSAIESVGKRQVIPYYCRPQCYYLDIRHEIKLHGIHARDHCLIQQITPRPPSTCECGTLRVVMRDGVLALDEVTQQDMKNGSTIHGLLLRVERDLEHTI